MYKTKKWTFKINSGHVLFMGEKIEQDSVFADNEQRAIEIMKNGYSIESKTLSLVSVEDVVLNGDMHFPDLQESNDLQY